MSDIVSRYKNANDAFTETLKSVKADQWGDATPCTEWDVRALVQHVTVEAAWVKPLLEGKTIAEVGSALDGDLLGADPVASFARFAAEANGAVDAPDALTVTTHLSFGDLPGEEYLRQMEFDCVIHRWDLAKAIGGDTSIDDGLAETLIAWFEPSRSALEGSNAFAAPVPLGETPTAGDRLIAMTGRDPR